MIKFESPLVADEVVRKLQGDLPEGFRSATLPIQFSAGSENSDAQLQAGLDILFKKADDAINEGVNVLVLSDRGISPEEAPIPCLLACSGLHHHLIPSRDPHKSLTDCRIRRTQGGPAFRPVTGIWG